MIKSLVALSLAVALIPATVYSSITIKPTGQRNGVLAFGVDLVY